MVIDVRVSLSALTPGSVFFMGAVLATTLAKLVLRFDELTSDSTALNMLCAEACLFFYCVLASWATLTTICNPGNVDHDLHHPRRTIQVLIDEDSHERILNCIQTLSELEATPAVHEIFLKDTKAVCTKVRTDLHPLYVVLTSRVRS